jgi:hypothetical protein
MYTVAVHFTLTADACSFEMASLFSGSANEQLANCSDSPQKFIVNPNFEGQT